MKSHLWISWRMRVLLLRRNLACKAVVATFKPKPHNAWVAPQKRWHFFRRSSYFSFFYKENLVATAHTYRRVISFFFFISKSHQTNLTLKKCLFASEKILEFSAGEEKIKNFSSFAFISLKLFSVRNNSTDIRSERNFYDINVILYWVKLVVIKGSK